uniref:Proline-rich receptor-like protein kinase PERK7 n=1 Tax=Crassostrea virginica TaxID=6565 RepID=A0A8B8CV02_CRAVI|nr:proline-rich receptor-like protein kinase PERK7 [Crassostrea virginica]
MDGLEPLLLIPLLSVFIGYVEAKHCYVYEYRNDDCDEDDTGLIVGAVIGAILGVLFILGIIAVICVKCCKTTKHGAVIHPNGGQSTQVYGQSTTVQPGGFSSTYVHATPTAPPQIWSYSTPQTGSSSLQNNDPPPYSFSGPTSSAGNVPPPPVYNDIGPNNNSFPPKY